MAIVYATSADLEAAPWSVSPLPANAARQLAYASQLVRTATRTAVYDVDAAGKPSDPEVLAGFRDAVCAQVSTWATLGIADPAAEAASTSGGVLASKGLGPRSVAYAGAEGKAAERVRVCRSLTDEAAGYLTDLGLYDEPWVTG